MRVKFEYGIYDSSSISNNDADSSMDLLALPPSIAFEKNTVC
jgi:hypothetical protein